MMRDRRVLVAGSGSIGRRHMRNLKGLGVGALAACDPDPERLTPMIEELGIAPFADYETALSQFAPDVVFICTPPVLHVDQACQAVERGMHVFLEKPVSNRPDGVEALASAASARGCVVQVGYNFRFHPGLRRLKAILENGQIGRLMWAHIEVGKYLPEWRRWQDYRQSYTARQELGGGIILDYSHELNYALWLMGEPTEVFCMARHASDLDVNVEDYAAILVRFKSGAHAALHMDFAQRQAVRQCKLAGTEGTATWNVYTNAISVFEANGDSGTLSAEQTTVDPNQPYVDEVAHFLRCIETGSTPEVGLAEGYRTLQVALAAHESAQTGRWVSL